MQTLYKKWLAWWHHTSNNPCNLDCTSYNPCNLECTRNLLNIVKLVFIDLPRGSKLCHIRQVVLTYRLILHKSHNNAVVNLFRQVIVEYMSRQARLYKDKEFLNLVNKRNTRSRRACMWTGKFSCAFIWTIKGLYQISNW